MANRDSENSVLTREQVLALDIATHTGYFSLHEAGTWNFTESKRRNGNKMHGAFRTTLLSLLRRYGIRRVVAEDVSVNRHFYDMRRLSELRGILLEVCDELDIPEPEFVNPAVLKKWPARSQKAYRMAGRLSCARNTSRQMSRRHSGAEMQGKR